MLTFITASAILALPAQQTTADHGTSAHARLHAPHPTLYLEVPDVDELLASYAGSAWAKAMSDPGLIRIFSGLSGEEIDPDGGPPIDEVLALVTEGEDELASILSLFEGATALSASAHLPGEGGMAALNSLMLMSPAEAVEETSVQVVFDYETADHAGSAVEEFWLLTGGEASPLAPVEQMPAGLEGQMLKGFGRPGDFEASFEVLRQGTRVILTAGAASVSQVVERGRGPAGPDPLGASRQHLQAAKGATIIELHNGLDDSLLQLLSAEAGSWILPAFDILEGMIGVNLTMMVRGGDWRVTHRDGRWITDGCHPMSSGPFGGVFASTPLPADALDAVPADAALAWVAGFDGDSAQQVVVDLLGGGAPEAEMMRIEARYGFRPDRDLIEPLGDSISWSMGANLPLAAPPLLGTIRLDDPETFGRGLEKLFDALGRGAGDEFTVRSRSYRKHPIYTIGFGSDGGTQGLPIDFAGMLSPSIVALEDRVLITLTAQQARRAVRAALGDDPEEPREGHPGLALGLTEGATEVAYADWMTILGNLYDGLLKTVAPMAGASLAEFGVELDSIPTSESYAGFFEPSVRMRTVVDGRVIHHAESSFGPEGALMGMAPFAVFGMTARPEPQMILVTEEVLVEEPPPPPSDDR